MTRLNKRERTLVIAFVAIAVVVVLVIAFSQSKQWWTASKLEQQLLTEQINIAEFWLQQRDEYQAKQAWLDEHLVPLTSRNEATSEFLSQLQTAAKTHAVEIKQQSILDPEKKEPLIRIRLELIAPIKPFIEWMNQVQQPTEMIAAPEIEIKAIPKSDDLNISVVMVKYFKAE